MLIALLILSSDTLLEVDRTGCYGTCPSYHLSVANDGTITWNGRHFVKQSGTATAKLTAKQIGAVRKAMTEIDFMNLNEDYNCLEVTDNPTVTLTYTDGVRRKEIVHYHGCRSKPGAEALTKLEDQLDQIVESVRWVGTKEERARARAH